MSQGFFIGIIVVAAIILILLIAIIVIFIIRFREYSKTKEKYDLLNKEI
jgi:heme/copper-type cytochrome/quinol oxidase subunit 2